MTNIKTYLNSLENSLQTLSFNISKLAKLERSLQILDNDISKTLPKEQKQKWINANPFKLPSNSKDLILLYNKVKIEIEILALSPLDCGAQEVDRAAWYAADDYANAKADSTNPTIYYESKDIARASFYFQLSEKIIKIIKES